MVDRFRTLDVSGDGWPEVWRCPRIIELDPRPPPDERWRGLAKRIHDAVAAGDLPADWGYRHLASMLVGVNVPAEYRLCTGRTKKGDPCRAYAITGHDTCHAHLP